MAFTNKISQWERYSIRLELRGSQSVSRVEKDINGLGFFGSTAIHDGLHFPRKGKISILINADIKCPAPFFGLGQG
jgi:hypothetical protein